MAPPPMPAPMPRAARAAMLESAELRPSMVIKKLRRGKRTQLLSTVCASKRLGKNNFPRNRVGDRGAHSAKRDRGSERKEKKELTRLGAPARPQAAAGSGGARFEKRCEDMLLHPCGLCSSHRPHLTSRGRGTTSVESCRVWPSPASAASAL